MFPTAWGIICISTVLTLLVLPTIVINGWARIKPVASHIRSVIYASALIIIITMCWMIRQIVQGTVHSVFFTIASITVSVLIRVIIERVDHGVEDLGVAVAKLHAMQTALSRLDEILFAEQCNGWLKSVHNLERMEKDIKVQYDGCGLNYLRRSVVSSKADQMLYIASDLLRQGEDMLQPKNHLDRTMDLYMTQVIGFINARTKYSGGLLGIWGMGGVGKTSLLKLLLGDSRSEYDDGSMQVLFVRAGTGCTVGQVQEAIVTSLGLSLGCNETYQAAIIRDHLNDKSFLLLIDDLWEYLDLKAVGIPWPLEGNSARQTRHKVVLTSRTIELCHDMECYPNNIIEMQCFSEENAWMLYHRGWSVINSDVVLPQMLQGQITSRSDRARRQLSRPQSHTVRLQHPKSDWLPGMSNSYEMVRPQELGRSLLVGMQRSYKKVCCFLEANNTRSLLMGIWGMQGVGKTALLRLVRDSYTSAACFDHIMLIGAGTGRVVNNVQHAIAINLGLDWGMMSSLDDLSRAQHIFDHLQHKSFLLLLDDIREPLNWWAVGLPILSHRQQKIIFATRSQAACALMGCDAARTIEVQCLGTDDAWKLFKSKVVLDDRPHFRHLAKQMVSQCKGLPLALSSLGRAMSNKRDPREWRSVYSQLEVTELKPWEIDDKVHTVLLYMVPEKPSDNTSPPEDDASHGQYPYPGIDFRHGHLGLHEMNRDVATQNLIAGWTPPSLTFTDPGAGRLRLPS